MKYRTEGVSDQDNLTFHVNKILSLIYFTAKSASDVNRYADGGRRITHFGYALLEVDGVIEFSVKKYEVTVKKGSIFSWSELTPQILSLLEKHFADGEKIEELLKS